MDLLNRICEEYGLGTLETQPVQLKGGFMHKMYSLFTSKGRYAVKLLNPYIMQRETAMENFRIAEDLEKKIEQSGIPILPAIIINDRKMQKIDERYFYLFGWYDGKALKSGEIEGSHCEKIGGILARIHGLDKRVSVCDHGEISVDWDHYIKLLESENKELYHLLKDNRTLLYESQRIRNKAVNDLPSVVSICHNDMDSKNVLWKGSDFRIIDLECLSYSSPVMEAYELALCWSGYEDCDIDLDLFARFIGSYQRAGGEFGSDAETVYNSNHGRLEWLEYNVKRSLGIECSAEETAVGISEVKDTMAHVIYYHDAKNDILHCLK